MKSLHIDRIQQNLNGILCLSSPFTMVELGKHTGLSMHVTRSVLIRLVALGVLRREKTEYHIIDRSYLKNGYQSQRGIW